jgi:hypothetical protein
MNKYIIPDITKIIVSYTLRKVDLKYSKTIQNFGVGRYFLSYKNDVYVKKYDYLHKITNNGTEQIEIPFTHRIHMFLNSNCVVFSNWDHHEINFNIYGLNSKNIRRLCCYPEEKIILTLNEKYIVAHNASEIYIYSINKKTELKKFTINFVLSDTETKIIDDIIYLVNQEKPKIHKYGISGNHIGDIEFDLQDWGNHMTTILRDEIVFTHYNKIKFYDSNGIHLNTISFDVRNMYCFVTDNDVYVSIRNIDIYKRVLP